MPLSDHTSDPRQKLPRAEAVIAELRGVVAELRKQIDAQQVHIHPLPDARAVRHARIN